MEQTFNDTFYFIYLERGKCTFITRFCRLYFPIDFLIRSQFSYTSSGETKSNFTQINIFLLLHYIILLRVCLVFPREALLVSVGVCHLSNSRNVQACSAAKLCSLIRMSAPLPPFGPSCLLGPYCKCDFRSIQGWAHFSNNSIQVQFLFSALS